MKAHTGRKRASLKRETPLQVSSNVSGVENAFARTRAAGGNGAKFSLSMGNLYVAQICGLGTFKHAATYLGEFRL
jgi:hypothetical protein